MLRALPRLETVALAIHAHHGSELDDEYPNLASWRTDPKRWVELPALGAITGLTELSLVGDVALPPDWRQLASLAVLAVHNDMAACKVYNVNDWRWGGFSWGGAEPLTALCSLTRLSIEGATATPGELGMAWVL